MIFLFILNSSAFKNNNNNILRTMSLLITKLSSKNTIFMYSLCEFVKVQIHVKYFRYLLEIKTARAKISNNLIHQHTPANPNFSNNVTKKRSSSVTSI